MKWLLAFATGCWQPAPPVTTPLLPAHDPVSLTMAVAYFDHVGIVEVRGDRIRTPIEYPAPPRIESLHWIGHTIAAVTSMDIYELRGHAFEKVLIDVPGLKAPPDSEPSWRSLSVIERPLEHDLLAEKCLYEHRDENYDATCLISAVVKILPSYELIETHRDPELATIEPRIPLPAVIGAPPNKRYVVTEENHIRCDGRDLAYASNVAPPLVETLVVDPPIVRVTEYYSWRGGPTGENYTIAEGCERSTRFANAVAAPDGSIVLYGDDLAVARNGHIVAESRDYGATAVAFPAE
ncbi:MAG: hypothetical protein QM831_42835 [Kofleriaceae bacterium]